MQPLDPSFAVEVESSFARQPVMNLIGAALTLVDPGVVEITLTGPIWLSSMVTFTPAT